MLQSSSTYILINYVNFMKTFSIVARKLHRKDLLQGSSSCAKQSYVKYECADERRYSNRLQICQEKNCIQWLVTLFPRLLREYIQKCNLNSIEALRNILQIYYPHAQLFTCHNKNNGQ
jgi:hypothetical protein